MSDDEDRRNYSDEEGEEVGFDDSDRDDDDSEEEEDDEEEMKRVRITRVYLLSFFSAARIVCLHTSPDNCPNINILHICRLEMDSSLTTMRRRKMTRMKKSFAA